MSIMGVLATARFLETFDRQVWLRPVTQRAVWRILDRAREDRQNWLRSYKSLERYAPTVYRDRTAGNQRLLFTPTAHGPLLLALGPRDTIYDTYSQHHLRSDLAKRPCELPPELIDRSKSGLFVDVAGPRQPAAYAAEENSASWAQYLDPQQYDLATRIGLETLDLDATKGQRRSWLITGGPGTGKTVVLLRVLMDALDAGLQVMLSMSPSVVRYHEAALSSAGVNCRLQDYIGDPSHPFRSGTLRDESKLDLLLVDDPRSLEQVKHALRWVDAARARAAVVAVDPLQLDETVTDSAWASVVKPRHVTEERLTACYRQRSAIGVTSLKAVQVIGSSSMYGRDDKKQKDLSSRRKLTAANNELEFVNPGGFQRIVAPATTEDVEVEIQRILETRHLWWQHWKPLMVAIDDDLGPPSANISEILRAVPHEIVRLEQDPDLDWRTLVPGVRSLKGAEFQHVLLFLSTPLYKELEHGFQAKGKTVYARRRLLRIPISRGRDSLVTFVWPRRFGSRPWPATERASIFSEMGLGTSLQNAATQLMSRGDSTGAAVRSM
jgi:hypothetical protein